MQIVKEGKLKYFLIFLAYLLAFINYIFIVKAIFSSAELTSFSIFLSSIKYIFKENSTDSLRLIFLINIIAVITFSILLFMLIIFKKAKSFGISNQQLAKLKIYQTKGFYVDKKKPLLGIFYALFPAGASLYLKHFIFGIISILTYPLSIFWEIIIGYFGSLQENYFATAKFVNESYALEEKKLDNLLLEMQDNGKSYIAAKKELDKKYFNIFTQNSVE
jgi:hypothetical protein